MSKYIYLIVTLGLFLFCTDANAQDTCPKAFWGNSLEEYKDCSSDGLHTFAITLPIKCKDDDSFTLNSVYIFAISGPAVVATGNCSIEINDSHIEGADGIVITEKARVSISNSVISSRSRSVILVELSSLSADNTLFKGKLLRKDWATFRDNGSNKFYD